MEPVLAICSCWWMTSAMMKFRNFSPNAGSRCDSTARGLELLDLLALTVRVGGGKTACGLEPTHLLGELEPFGEEMHERRVDIVDALAEAQ
jgi:hypothetical protein